MNDKKLLALLSFTLTGNTIDKALFCDTSPKEWKDIFTLSCPHGVAAVAYDAVSSLPKECQPPKMIQISWILESEKAERSYALKCSIIERLAGLTASHGLEFVLLKGASTASYYPTPGHRYFGDIDFYVLDKKTNAIVSKESDRLISENFNIPTDTSKHHHNTYTFEGVLLENHYDFIESHSHKSSARLETELKKLAVEPRGTITLFQDKNASPATINKAPATFNAVFLLKHMASHFAAGEIGLRHILDYGLFLKAEHQNIDFETVHTIFDRFHLTHFASAVNSILVNRLSLPKEFTSGDLADTSLTEKVLKEVIHPAFPIYSRVERSMNVVESVLFRTRRFFANRWKHDLIYPENFWVTLFRASFSHLLKPKSIIK